MKRIVVALMLVAACAATCADSLSDTMVLDTEQVVSSSTTYNAKITGSGSFKVTNGATLTLNNTNEFTGGVVVDYGTFHTKNALNNTSTFAGTGTITLNCTGSRTCCWLFSSKPPNNVVINGNSSLAYPATDQEGGANLLGTVTANGDFYIGGTGYDRRADGITSEKISFSAVNAAGHTIGGALHMLARFDGTITCETLSGEYRTITTASNTGRNGVMGGFVLNASGNSIGTIRLDHQNVWCKKNGAINGAALEFTGQHSPMSVTYNGTEYLTGHVDLNRSGSGAFTQTFKSISSDAWPRGTAVGYEIRNSCGTAATLKITGAENTSASCYVAVNSKNNVQVAAPATFRQTFRDRASTTTGSISISGGELELAGTATFANVPSVTISGGKMLLNSTLAGSLAGVSSVALSGTGELALGADTAAPFTEGKVALTVTGNDARITSGGTHTIVVKSLTFGDATMSSGEYTSANLSCLGTGVTLVVLTGGEATSLAWTAQGADEKTSTAANWDFGGDVPDFSTTRYAPLFAAGSCARVVGTMWAGGLTFDAPAPGFTLAPFDGSASLKMSVDTSIACAPAQEGANPRDNEVSVPLTVLGLGDFMLVAATNETLRVTGGLSGEARIVTGGGGTVELSGMQDYAGAICISNAHARLLGAIGSTDNTSAMDLYWKNGRDAALTRSYLYLSNAVINLPFKPYGTGVSENEDHNWLSVEPFTTNIFAQSVVIGSSCVMKGDNGATLVFRKGRNTYGLHANGHDYTMRVNSRNTLGTSAAPAVFRFESPISISGTGKASFNVDARNIKVVFASQGNYMGKGFLFGYGAIFETEVDDVFTTNAWLSCANSTTVDDTLDLKATHQQLGWFVPGNYTPTIKGEYPSALEIRVGATSSELTTKRFNGTKFKGWVGLTANTIATNNTCVLNNVQSESYGDVTVTRGIMSFSANSSWLNGTNVTVGAEGTLKIASANTFNKDVAVLHLAEGGTIDIPAGVTQVFAKGWLGNTPLKAGSRHATGSVSYVTGGGAFRIAGGGMTILFR